MVFFQYLRNKTQWGVLIKENNQQRDDVMQPDLKQSYCYYHDGNNRRKVFFLKVDHLYPIMVALTIVECPQYKFFFSFFLITSIITLTNYKLFISCYHYNSHF